MIKDILEHLLPFFLIEMGDMEKITEKIAVLPQDANFFSLEFFPPKTRIVSFPEVRLRYLQMIT